MKAAYYESAKRQLHFALLMTLCQKIWLPFSRNCVQTKV